MDHHYLQIPYLWIHLLARICNPRMNTHRTFAVIREPVQWNEQFDSSDGHVPSWVETRWYFAFLLPPCCKQVIFRSILGHVFAFLWFFLVILPLKWPPSIVVKCCLVFPSTRRLRCALQKQTRVFHELCSGVGYSADGCEFKFNESTMYIKWNTFKQKHTLKKIIY